MASQSFLEAKGYSTCYYLGVKARRQALYDRVPFSGKIYLLQREAGQRRLYRAAQEASGETKIYRINPLMKENRDSLWSLSAKSLSNITGTDLSPVAFAIKIGLPQREVALLNETLTDILPIYSSLEVIPFSYDKLERSYVRSKKCDWFEKGVDYSGKSPYKVFLRQGMSLEEPNEVGLLEVKKEKILSNGPTERACSQICGFRDAPLLVARKVSKGKYSASFLTKFDMSFMGSEIGQGHRGHTNYLFRLLKSLGINDLKFLESLYGFAKKGIYDIKPEAVKVSIAAESCEGIPYFQTKTEISLDYDDAKRTVEILPQSRTVYFNEYCQNEDGKEYPVKFNVTNALSEKGRA